MKKILVSAYACLPNHGSEEGNGWNYATLLSQEGYEVHCLTREQGRVLIEPLLANGYFPNLTVHYVPVPAWVENQYGNLIGLYFHYLYWQWQAANVAQRLDRVVNFDLVHHLTYSSIQLGSNLYRVGKPFLFGPVGGGQQAPPALKSYFGAHWWRERVRDYISWILRHVNPGFYKTMKKADQVLISNEDTLALAKQLRPRKPILKVLDAGLQRSFVPERPIERQPGPVMNLLWVGRLMPRKALELTIEAFSRVDPKLPITLTIVGGKGEMAGQVPCYLSRYGVADRVRWVGHVSYEAVKAYYSQSDVFFFTSLRDSCPMQIMEAMAYSLPTITLAIHGQNEIINERNGIKVPVTNREQVLTDLARAVERLYANPDERLRMGREARRFAELQVWEEKVKTYVQKIYPALLATKLITSVVVD